MNAAALAGSSVREGLRALGIERAVLGIFDASFPGDAAEDPGRGSPYSASAGHFFEFVASLGLNGVQLGPQGETEPDDPSPYRSTLFARNGLSLALGPLTSAEPWAALLAGARLDALGAGGPPPDPTRADHVRARRTLERGLDALWEGFCARRPSEARVALLAARFEAFVQRHRRWLARDELYAALRREHGGVGWRHWSSELDRRLWDPRPAEREAAARRRRALARRHRRSIGRYRFAQFLLHEQHRELRRHLQRLGLDLYGDLPIGCSERDEWCYRALFLEGYRMGAPPSRTNPAGQPWDYPVLDPDLYRSGTVAEGGRARPGPALLLLRARLGKLWSEYDAVRIDHPHGYIDPWVYRSDLPDPFAAVQGGARLFSSPTLPDHPDLARFAIVSPAQLDPQAGTLRYADHWVARLGRAEVKRYSLLFDEIVATGRRRGRPSSSLVAEVLSTLPRPVAAVLARHGLGRFRVAQKADLANPADVYRSENAAPQDWVMVGNHDTSPLWALLPRWQRSGELRARAAHLARRLCPAESARAPFEEALAREPGRLAQAQFAELFAGPARNVQIFFTDLFGLEEPFNRPGTVSAENWSLRLPPSYRRDYAERLRTDRALNLPAALALALRSRGEAFAARHGALVGRLEGAARALVANA